jgi:hypothetical protein
VTSARRRARRIEWLLLATLLPLYLATQVGLVKAYRASDGRVAPLRVSPAQGADGYPIVLTLRTPHPQIHPGDRVLRLGSLSLRGLSRGEIEHRVAPLLGTGRPFEAELERGGARFTTSVEPVPHPAWWWPLPSGSIVVTFGTFLLLRASHRHLARHYFVLALAFACLGASVAPAPVHAVQKVFGHVVVSPVITALLPWSVLA